MPIRHEMTEKEYLANYDISKYDRPALTADVVALSVQDLPTANYRAPIKPTMSVLLIRRGGFPQKGMWALPGGFSKRGETIEQTAERELLEETGLRGQVLTHVDVFSKPGRDKRGWIVSSAYLAIVPKSNSTVRGGDDAADAKWVAVDDVLRGKVKLAFDHLEIIKAAIAKLRPLDRDEFAFAFLPPHFTLAELQYVFEFMDGQTLHVSNFRRKMTTEKKVLPVTDEKAQGLGHRPAGLYRKGTK